MKKINIQKRSAWWFWCLIGGALMAAGGAVYYYSIYQYRVPAVRVGLVLARNIYSHTKAYEGFLRKHSQVEKKKVYEMRPFYFQGDEHESIAKAVQELCSWEPDVVVVDGYFATPYVAGEVKDRPIVFIGVDDCVERKLVSSLERPGGMITGVIAGDYDRLAMAAMLQSVKPGARNVLLPYDLNDDVGGLVIRDAKAVARMLAKEKVAVTILPLKDMSDALGVLTPLLKEHDVLMTLECDPLEALMEPLVSLCKKTETTFFPGSLGGMEAGSVLSFGGHAQVLGKRAFLMVQMIAEEGKLPADMPIERVTGHRQLVINASQAATQHMQPINEKAVRLRLLRYNNSSFYELNLKIL